MTQQYALDISLPVAYAPEQFITSQSNTLALHWIESWPEWPGFALYLHGEQGSGKTHLAHIWKQKTSAVFLPADSTELPQQATIIDNIETWKNEDALFHLFNHCKLANIPLLITANRQPDKLLFTLPDLNSRLRSLPVTEIHAPDDALLEAVLYKQLADRQLKIPADVVSYLLPRLPRSFSELSALVAKLDSASLAAGRTLTIPYIRQVLDW